MGKFAATGDKVHPAEWVRDNNIVAFFEAGPDKDKEKIARWRTKYANKKILVRNPKTGKTMEATILDTCADTDCPHNNCCTTNANKNGGYLVDFEYNTAARFWGGEDKIDGLGKIEWKLM